MVYDPFELLRNYRFGKFYSTLQDVESLSPRQSREALIFLHSILWKYPRYVRLDLSPDSKLITSYAVLFPVKLVLHKSWCMMSGNCHALNERNLQSLKCNIRHDIWVFHLLHLGHQNTIPDNIRMFTYTDSSLYHQSTSFVPWSFLYVREVILNII